MAARPPILSLSLSRPPQTAACQSPRGSPCGVVPTGCRCLRSLPDDASVLVDALDAHCTPGRHAARAARDAAGVRETQRRQRRGGGPRRDVSKEARALVDRVGADVNRPCATGRADRPRSPARLPAQAGVTYAPAGRKRADTSPDGDRHQTPCHQSWVLLASTRPPPAGRRRGPRGVPPSARPPPVRVPAHSPNYERTRSSGLGRRSSVRGTREFSDLRRTARNASSTPQTSNGIGTSAPSTHSGSAAVPKTTCSGGR